MSAGLAASTVTPGSTAPDSSRTTPPTVPVERLCAPLAAGARASPHAITRHLRMRSFMAYCLPSFRGGNAVYGNDDSMEAMISVASWKRAYGTSFPWIGAMLSICSLR
jgi:hypothetical protein